MSFYIIVRGPLGCGKSAIAKKLSKILKAECISIDSVLHENNLTKERENGYISQKSFLKANEIISPEVKSLLEKGIHVVIDGNFYWKSQIDDLIKRLDFPHYVFTLKAPLNVCIERDSKSTKPNGKDATKTVYKKSVEFDYGIVVDVNRSFQECIKGILSRIPKADKPI